MKIGQKSSIASGPNQADHLHNCNTSDELLSLLSSYYVNCPSEGGRGSKMVKIMSTCLLNDPIAISSGEKDF